jgi:hypothetical protein
MERDSERVMCKAPSARRGDSIAVRSLHATALLSALDVQARGGGGAAERLHASGRHLTAAEVQRAERMEAPRPLPCNCGAPRG